MRRLNQGTLRGLALGLPLYLVAAHVWSFVLIAPQFAPRSDFRALYAGAYLAWNGESRQLYDFNLQEIIESERVSPEPSQLFFVNPPYFAALLAPLAALSYRSAYVAMFAINIVLLAAILALLWSRLKAIREIYPWLPIALVLGFHPVAVALIMGQSSLLLCLLVVAAFLLLEKKPGIAGALLACGLFKFQLVLPIAVLFLLWRRWKFSAGFSAIAGVLVAVSVALSGVSYLHATAAAQNLWAMIPNLAGATFSLFGESVYAKLIFVILSAVALVASFIVGRKRTMQDQLLIAIPCAILVSYHCYLHDLSVLVLPALLLLERGLRRGKLNYAAVGMLVLPMIESFAPNFVFILAISVGCLAITLSDGEIHSESAQSLQREHLHDGVISIRTFGCYANSSRTRSKERSA